MNSAWMGRSPDGSWRFQFLLAHWLPALMLALAGGVMMSFNGDEWLADQLYAWQGHHWLYQSSFLTEKVVHILGRNLSIAAWLVVLGTWLLACRRPELESWRKPLVYLLVATLLSTLLVSWIKSWSNMDCPWDLARYGGDRDYIGLLSLRPVGMPRAACFPAGHASAGYMWLALYFFFLAARPRWRWPALSLAISLGLLFGLVQQLRGAHFMSHDLWTAAICWASAVGCYVLFQGWFQPSAATRREAIGPHRNFCGRDLSAWTSRAGAL